VAFFRFSCSDAVEAFERAVTMEATAIFFLVRAVMCMVFCCIFGVSADVAVEEVSRVFAIFGQVG
jgi:hypothetical protein